MRNISNQVSDNGAFMSISTNAWIARLFRLIASNAMDFVYPPLCILCDLPRNSSPSSWFCDKCLGALEQNHATRDACPRCGQNRTLRDCACALVWDYPFDRIYSLFDFDERIKKAVHQFKYKHRSAVARELGKLFSSHIPRELLDADIFLPVPLHWRRKLERGYNQSEHLARGMLAGRAEQDMLITGALKRRRQTHTQTKLDRAQRQRNLENAFVVAPGFADCLHGKTAVLIDDVVTTGSTTGICAQTLLDAGVRNVSVLSLARD